MNNDLVMNILSSTKQGFTLLELLVVMAILGTLAVISFLAINPTERSAQARDTGRLNAVTQLGRSMQGYYSSRGDYPAVGNWAQELVDIGELPSFPSGIEYSAYSVSNCTSYVQPGIDPTFCYNVDALNGALVYSRAEANSDNNKCTAPEVAYYVFSTADGHGGTICSDGEPTPWASGTQGYVN